MFHSEQKNKSLTHANSDGYKYLHNAASAFIKKNNIYHVAVVPPILISLVGRFGLVWRTISDRSVKYKRIEIFAVVSLAISTRRFVQLPPISRGAFSE